MYFFSRYKEQMFFSHDQGFSILEMLLTISIIALIGGLSLPLYYSFQAKNDLDLATDVITQTVRRAQVLSRTMTYDDGWGVYIIPETVIVFKGNTYAGRDPAYDELSILASSVLVDSNPIEIIFTKMTGEPVGAPLVITLRSTSVSNTSIITINEKGTISF